MADETTRLDELLVAARFSRQDIPDDLVGRILTDADRIQTNRYAGPRAVAERREPGLWRQLLNSLGGWPGLGGMAAACATGVWIGMFPPDILPDPSDLVFQTQSDGELLGYYGLVDVLGGDG
ncbi:hypothetical protein OEZ49_11975 [Ruegeria sp. WL0004]|uniref:Dihydroorotate dehydrogenase n=1 Tax=Ruegeria marisflavi TaxID=2984152 RepID=A0ABT2WRK0_9RHOB|nr:hypothetical protein [Ruegeria sp. WL0004]MCU9838486.1 hypothetical protein [Ruegeria sp. WL0004]